MKKVIALLLAAVMLLSLTITAAYAEDGGTASKIDPKLAERITVAAEDEKLPVAVTANLKISAEEREGFERYAAEQAGVEYGGYYDHFNADRIKKTGEEKELYNAERAKWNKYDEILYPLLRDTRLDRINAVLDASGADIEDMDGGFYTTACLMLPKRLMLTPAQINALAELELVTKLSVSAYKDPVPAQKDMSKIITEELAARLDEAGEDERVSVYLRYGAYNSPYKIVGNNDNSYEPTDQVIRDMYSIRTTDLNSITDPALFNIRKVARKYYNKDYKEGYSEPLRMKTLDLSEDDTYVYFENGKPNAELLKLTKSKLYEIIQKDNITLASLVDPYADPPESEEPTPGYFIIGTMTDWELDQHYKISGDVDEDSTLYFTLFMNQDDSFKIVYSPDGRTLENATYYPAGRGNAFNQENPIILRNTFYKFQFRPACDGGITYFVRDYWWTDGKVQTWYYNCIYCLGYDPWTTYSSKDPNLSNPDPNHNEPEPGYYIVGTMTDWQLNKSYKFSDSKTYQGFTLAEFGFITLRMCDEFKIAYSEDGVNITRWYPEGDGNAYNQDVRRIFYDHNLVSIIFTPYGNGGESAFQGKGASHYGMITPLYGEYGGERGRLQIPAEGELFKAKLKDSYRLSDEDFTDYDELCYHKDKDGITDWVLLRTKAGDSRDLSYCDVIANRAYMQDQLSSPFESSYGIYDVSNKEFINLTGDIVKQYKDLGRIFDKLGEGRLIGDVDGDNELTAIDCTFMQRYATRIGDWPDNDIIQQNELRDKLNTSYFSDFDRDGERDIVDATRLQRYVIGLD